MDHGASEDDPVVPNVTGGLGNQGDKEGSGNEDVSDTYTSEEVSDTSTQQVLP